MEGDSPAPATPIEQKYHDLQLAHKRLQQELKQLQHEDFNNARNKNEGQSHHVVSAKFLDMFRMSTDWARDYFKIPFSAFRIEEHELFAKNLERVLCAGCEWPKKKKMNVSHLVQAVVAEILARRILLSQFVGCPTSAQHVLGQIYDAMLEEDESRAYKWRASTFAAYERCDVWAPLDPSAPPEPTSSLRQEFHKAVADEIEEVVGPIARKHFPDRGDHENRLQGLLEFVEAAGDLAVVLSRQAAKLEIMDKSWFERSPFVCDDDRMKGRFAEEDEESEEGFQVDIVLRPGFLKYGNDEGESLEKYAVWIPAMLDLSEKSCYEDAQEAMGMDMLGGSATAPHVDEGIVVKSAVVLPPRVAEAAETESKSAAHPPLSGHRGKPPKPFGRSNPQAASLRHRGVFVEKVKKVKKWSLRKWTSKLSKEWKQRTSRSS